METEKNQWPSWFSTTTSAKVVKAESRTAFDGL